APASPLPATSGADSGGTQLDPIIVTATLKPLPESEIPGSVSVLDSNTLRDAGRQNFEDVLALVPNFNWAGDTSLPRYFQIRGIGELQQYQGAPNPSVGFLIDDIDFSGLGMAAPLFDLDHKRRACRHLRRPRGIRRGRLRRTFLRRGDHRPGACARFGLQARRAAI